MRNFQYISREYVPPVDLNVLGQTYSTLEQGHQQAVQTSSDLQAAMAQLELNEAEDAWRQQKINEIKQTIADNTTFGNAYGALDDLIAKKGNLISDPGLLGRLRAQQDYKTYQQKVDAMNIPEHYKDYYKKANPYYYQDHYDSKGNVIGGSKWIEKSNPVATQDYNKLMQLAIQYASPRKYKSVNNRFLNKDGSITITPKDPNATPVLYDTTTMSIVELTKEDLKQGLEAALKASPEYFESLQQDYKIALDDYNNNKQSLYNVQSSKGGHMTFDEFKDSIFEPMYKSKSYKYIEDIQTIPKQIANDRYNNTFGGRDSNYRGLIGNLSPYALPANNVEYADRSINNAMIGEKNANAELKHRYNILFKNNTSDEVKSALENIDARNPETFNKVLPELLGSDFKDLNVDLSNRDSVKSALENKYGKDSESVYTDMQYYDSIISPYRYVQNKYAEDIHNMQRFYEQYGGTKYAAAIETENGMLYGFKDPKDMSKHELERYTEYNSLINSYFPIDSMAMVWSITDTAAYNDMMTTLDNNPELKKAITIQPLDNGAQAFILPKDKKEFIFEFRNAVGKARKSRNMWHEFWQDVKGSVSSYGDHLYYIDEEGNSQSYDKRINGMSSRMEVARFVGAGNFKRFFVKPGLQTNPVIKLAEEGFITDTDDIFQGLDEFTYKLYRHSNKELYGKEKYIQSVVYAGSTPESIIAHGEIANVHKLGLSAKDAQDFVNQRQSVAKDSDENTLNYLLATSFANCSVKEADENGILRDVNSARLNELQKELSLNISDAKVFTFLDPTLRKYVHKVSFNYKEDKDIKHREITIDYGVNNPLDIINNDPTLNARADFMLAYNENRHIRIGNYAGGDYIYAVPVQKGVFEIKMDSSEKPISIIDVNTEIGKELYENLIFLKAYTEQFNNFDQYYYNITNEEFENLKSNYKTLLGRILNIDMKNEKVNELFDKSIAKELISNNYSLWD